MGNTASRQSLAARELEKIKELERGSTTIDPRTGEPEVNYMFLDAYWSEYPASMVQYNYDAETGEFRGQTVFGRPENTPKEMYVAYHTYSIVDNYLGGVQNGMNIDFRDDLWDNAESINQMYKRDELNGNYNNFLDRMEQMGRLTEGCDTFEHCTIGRVLQFFDLFTKEELDILEAARVRKSRPEHKAKRIEVEPIIRTIHNVPMYR